MKRGPLIAVVAAGVVLLAVAGLVLWLLQRPPGPQAVAEDYLRALAGGDAETALDLVASDSLDPSMIEAAFAGATATISDAEVTGVIEDGETATASITYTLDSTSGSGELMLQQTPTGWKVAPDGLGTVTITSALGDAAAIGTAVFGVNEPVVLLPALYQIDAAPVGILTGALTVAVAPGSAATAALQPQLSDTALETASAQVQAYVDACTAPADAVPENCGIRVPWAADLATLTSLSFRVETAPTLAFAEDLSSFAATGGVLVATASGTTRDGSAGTFTYRTDDWSLRGGMAFTGNQLVLSVD
ncbi:hypothetical protein [Microbacterium sp.]|uniref:Rv0361 family membrane protein n=1 Tax=Microbacterium sp. TaxID=51671 RepID=UPI0026059D6C|nr:hypothetical protein [Microbacterium sp.]